MIPISLVKNEEVILGGKTFFRAKKFKSHLLLRLEKRAWCIFVNYLFNTIIFLWCKVVLALPENVGK